MKAAQQKKAALRTDIANDNCDMTAGQCPAPVAVAVLLAVTNMS